MLISWRADFWLEIIFTFHFQGCFFSFQTARMGSELGRILGYLGGKSSLGSRKHPPDPWGFMMQFDDDFSNGW